MKDLSSNKTYIKVRLNNYTKTNLGSFKQKTCFIFNKKLKIIFCLKFLTKQPWLFFNRH